MFLLNLLSIAWAHPAAIADNVVIVIADGLREEEVYGGGDESLVIPEQQEGAQVYCQGTPEQRRKKLMPFLWSAFANIRIPTSRIWDVAGLHEHLEVPSRLASYESPLLENYSIFIVLRLKLEGDIAT